MWLVTEFWKSVNTWWMLWTYES